MLATSRKADPYGSTIPSPIPPPAKPGVEIVPTYDPPGIPSYLKPIPVNTRDITRVLQRYIDRNNRKLARWLYSTWNAEAAAVKDQEIRNAIRDGQIPESWLQQWQQDYSRWVVEVWEPEARAAMQATAKLVAAGIEEAGYGRAEWDEAGERVREWIETRGTELAVNLTTEQHRALQALIRHLGIEQGLGPEELSRYLRPVIGLTYKEEEAVVRFRQALLEAGEDPRKVVHKTQNYASWLRRRRAMRIAVTELAFALNYGQFEAVRQAVDQSVLPAGRVIKRWDTAEDERTCRFCGPMHGRVVGLEQTFPGGTKRLPNIYVPPAHPWCRCSVIYEVLEDITGKSVVLFRVSARMDALLTRMASLPEVAGGRH